MRIGSAYPSNPRKTSVGRATSATKTDIRSYGKRAGLPSDVAEKMKALERENRELRQANEILRKASAYFAMAELDRPFKR